MIYTETLSNPTLVVADIPGLAAIARAKVRVVGGPRLLQCTAQSTMLVLLMPSRPHMVGLARYVATSPHATGPLPQSLKLVVDNTFTPLVLSPLR